MTQLPNPGDLANNGWEYNKTNQDWALYVKVKSKYSPQLFGLGDALVYHSNQTYPPSAYGGGFKERYGEWAYYYE